MVFVSFPETTEWLIDAVKRKRLTCSALAPQLCEREKRFYSLVRCCLGSDRNFPSKQDVEPPAVCSPVELKILWQCPALNPLCRWQRSTRFRRLSLPLTKLNRMMPLSLSQKLLRASLCLAGGPSEGKLRFVIETMRSRQPAKLWHACASALSTRSTVSCIQLRRQRNFRRLHTRTFGLNSRLQTARGPTSSCPNRNEPWRNAD